MGENGRDSDNQTDDDADFQSAAECCQQNVKTEISGHKCDSPKASADVRNWAQEFENAPNDELQSTSITIGAQKNPTDMKMPDDVNDDNAPRTRDNSKEKKDKLKRGKRSKKMRNLKQ